MQLRLTTLGAKGALFFATVLTLYLATPYSNLFFLLLAFLAVLGLLGAAGAARNLHGVSATLVAVDAAPVGGAHEVALRIAAPPARRMFSLAADLIVDGRRLPVGVLPLAADGAALPGHVRGLPRGIHAVTAIELHSIHPLGVCRARRRLPIAAEIVTHPAPASLTTADRGDGEGGDRHRHRPLDESVAGLRDWRQGDTLRAVHWRATARRGEPVVKEFEHEHGEGLEIAVDRRCAEAELERALAVATAHVLDARDRQQPLQLRSQGFDQAHAADRPGTAAMLRWLATAQPLPPSAPPPPPVGAAALRLPASANGGAK